MTAATQRADRQPEAAPQRSPNIADVAALERDADMRADRALGGRDLAGPGLRPPIAEPEAGFAGLGAGKRLPPALDRRLSQSFGLNLSGLRVHTDAKAHGIADSMGAEAAIAGNDIVLGPGASDLETPAAAELLAHEVAHYAQAADQSDLPQVQRKEGKF